MFNSKAIARGVKGCGIDHAQSVGFRRTNPIRGKWEVCTAPPAGSVCREPTKRRSVHLVCDTGERDGAPCKSVRLWCDGSSDRSLIELFLVPGNVPRLMKQRLWYVLSCL